MRDHLVLDTIQIVTSRISQCLLWLLKWSVAQKGDCWNSDSITYGQPSLLFVVATFWKISPVEGGNFNVVNDLIGVGVGEGREVEDDC